MLSMVKKKNKDHFLKKLVHEKSQIALTVKNHENEVISFSRISFLPVDSINTDEMNQCTLLIHLSQCASKKIIDYINADFPREKTIYFLINLHVIGL